MEVQFQQVAGEGLQQLYAEVAQVTCLASRRLFVLFWWIYIFVAFRLIHTVRAPTMKLEQKRTTQILLQLNVLTFYQEQINKLLISFKRRRSITYCQLLLYLIMGFLKNRTEKFTLILVVHLKRHYHEYLTSPSYLYTQTEYINLDNKCPSLHSWALTD